MVEALASIVAQALGLPEWAPRALRRVAVWFLILTAAFLPVVFRQGMAMWVNQETTRIMKLMLPVIDGMAPRPASPAPSRMSRPSDAHARATTP